MLLVERADLLGLVDHRPVAAAVKDVDVGVEVVLLFLGVLYRQVGVAIAPQHQRGQRVGCEGLAEALTQAGQVGGRAVEREHAALHAPVGVVEHPVGELARERLGVVRVEQGPRGAPGGEQLEELADDR